MRFTFGIPGVHNTEIYDQLASSPTITPIRVTTEVGGSFMADAVSRTNDHVGAMLIVPAAGAAVWALTPVAVSAMAVASAALSRLRLCCSIFPSPRTLYAVTRVRRLRSPGPSTPGNRSLERAAMVVARAAAQILLHTYSSAQCGSV